MLWPLDKKYFLNKSKRTQTTKIKAWKFWFYFKILFIKDIMLKGKPSLRENI